MEILNNSTFLLNVIVVIIFIVFIFRGYAKGVVNQFFNLFSLFGALFIAWFLYRPFGALFRIAPPFLAPFQDTILHEFFYLKINGLLWFIILFIAGFVFIKFLKLVFNTAAKVPGISFINKILGAMFGCVNAVIVSFVFVYILSMPLFTNGASLVKHSLLSPIVTISEDVMPVIADQIKQVELLDIFIKNPSQATIEDILLMQKYLNDNKIPLNIVNEFLMEIK